MEDRNETLKRVLEHIEFYRACSVFWEEITSTRNIRFVIESEERYGAGRIAWVDWLGDIHILGLFLDNAADVQCNDTMIYQMIIHELVHIKQYRSMGGFGKFWARTFGRNRMEHRAEMIGKDGEIYIREHLLKR